MSSRHHTAEEVEAEHIEVARLAAEACSACQFARDWRNPRLAHRDLALALDQGAQPLAGVSRQDVERALKERAFSRVLP